MVVLPETPFARTKSCFTRNKNRFQTHQTYKPVKTVLPEDLFVVLHIHCQCKAKGADETTCNFSFFTSIHHWANRLSVRAKRSQENVFYFQALQFHVSWEHFFKLCIVLIIVICRGGSVQGRCASPQGNCACLP